MKKMKWQWSQDLEYNAKLSSDTLMEAIKNKIPVHFFNGTMQSRNDKHSIVIEYPSIGGISFVMYERDIPKYTDIHNSYIDLFLEKMSFQNTWEIMNIDGKKIHWVNNINLNEWFKDSRLFYKIKYINVKKNVVIMDLCSDDKYKIPNVEVNIWNEGRELINDGVMVKDDVYNTIEGLQTLNIELWTPTEKIYFEMNSREVIINISTNHNNEQLSLKDVRLYIKEVLIPYTGISKLNSYINNRTKDDVTTIYINSRDKFLEICREGLLKDVDLANLSETSKLLIIRNKKIPMFKGKVDKPINYNIKLYNAIKDLPNNSLITLRTNTGIIYFNIKGEEILINIMTNYNNERISSEGVQLYIEQVLIPYTKIYNLINYINTKTVDVYEKDKITKEDKLKSSTPTIYINSRNNFLKLCENGLFNGSKNITLKNVQGHSAITMTNDEIPMFDPKGFLKKKDNRTEDEKKTMKQKIVDEIFYDNNDDIIELVFGKDKDSVKIMKKSGHRVFVFKLKDDPYITNGYVAQRWVNEMLFRKYSEWGLKTSYPTELIKFEVDNISALLKYIKSKNLKDSIEMTPEELKSIKIKLKDGVSIPGLKESDFLNWISYSNITNRIKSIRKGPRHFILYME